jgi:hypothetical protein
MQIESRKQDLIAVLNSMAGSKDLAWKGDTLNCPFCHDKSRSAGIYDRGTAHWRFKCQQHGCTNAGPYDLSDLLALRQSVPLAEVLREQGKEARIEGGGDGGMRPLERTSSRSLYPLSHIKNKFSKPLVHLYRPLGNGALPAATHGVVRFFDPESKNKKGYRQFSRDDVTQDLWQMVAPAKPWCLYNLNAVKNSEKIFFVEGEQCVDRVTMGGFAAVSTMGGAGKGKYADLGPLAGKAVYLWPDHDEPGYSHMREIRVLLSELEPKCRIFWVDPVQLGLTDPKSDVVDYLNRFPASSWHQELGSVMAGAAPFGLGAEFMGDMNDMISGKLSVVPLPFPVLSAMTNALKARCVSVVCAPGGSRKSFFLLQCLRFWKDRDVRFACMMLEDVRTYHMTRLLAQLSCDARLTDENWLQESPENGAYARDLAQKHLSAVVSIGENIHIPPKDHMVTLAELALWVEKQAASGVRVICIDPVTFADKGSDPVWVADRKFLYTVKSIVEKYDCSLVLITHPKQGMSKTFNMDSMAGGAAFQQVTQTIIWIEALKEPKSVMCISPCGRTNVSINGRFYMMKTRNAGGFGKSVGFRWIGSELAWSEQGLIVG